MDAIPSIMDFETTELFPSPASFPPSSLSPTVWPGVSSESTEALRSVLVDNHERYHAFLEEVGPRHNHITHHSLAIWALGAPKDLIEAAYKHDAMFQIPSFASPESITANNYNEHLGDGKYANAYMAFFKDSVLENGTAAVFEEYLFSPKFNFDPSLPAGKKQAQMLNRLMSTLFHPLIHMGYGAEFSLPGMIIEALAMTASHKPLPVTFFEGSADPLDEKVTSRLQSTLLGKNATTKSASKVTRTHAFTIVARILKDPQFAELEAEESEEKLESHISKAFQRHGDAVFRYVNEWTLDASDPREVERKIGEIQWVMTILYAIPGWTAGKPFTADFFFMHLVTSSLFIPSLVAYLSPRSQALLLQTYFAAGLVYWIGRGRPGLDIPGFFADDTAYPLPQGTLPTLPTPPEWALSSPSSPFATTPNPWFHLIQRTITDPDDHLCKLVRALAHYGGIYGARPAGLPDFSGTELPGAEKLDGTLFIRAAGLTCSSGSQHGYEWRREGYFERE